MFRVPSPASPPHLHDRPVQEHMANSLNFSVALFHLQDFPSEISGRAATHSNQELSLGLAKSQVFLIHSHWSPPLSTSKNTDSHTPSHAHGHQMESALPGRKLPISRPAPTLKSTGLASLAGRRPWQGPRDRRPQSPAVLPQNSSRFSRVKAFQFVVCFRSIYSALKWLFWTIFPVLCSFHRKEPPVPTPLFPEVSPPGFSQNAPTKTREPPALGLPVSPMCLCICPDLPQNFSKEVPALQNLLLGTPSLPIFPSPAVG